MLYNDIGYALTQPVEVSIRAVLAIWTTSVYSFGNHSVPPSICFTHNLETMMITPTVVREALYIPAKHGYNLSIDDQVMSDFLTLLRNDDNI